MLWWLLLWASRKKDWREQPDPRTPPGISQMAHLLSLAEVRHFVMAETVSPAPAMTKSDKGQTDE